MGAGRLSDCVPCFMNCCVLLVSTTPILQEALWTLSATKTGEEATYQGVLSGTVSITNSKPVPVAVYGVLTAVKGGPSAVVSCGPTSMPFNVGAVGVSRVQGARAVLRLLFVSNWLCLPQHDVVFTSEELFVRACFCGLHLSAGAGLHDHPVQLHCHLPTAPRCRGVQGRYHSAVPAAALDTCRRGNSGNSLQGGFVKVEVTLSGYGEPDAKCDARQL